MFSFLKQVKNDNETSVILKDLIIKLYGSSKFNSNSAARLATTFIMNKDIAGMRDLRKQMYSSGASKKDVLCKVATEYLKNHKNVDHQFITIAKDLSIPFSVFYDNELDYDSPIYKEYLETLNSEFPSSPDVPSSVYDALRNNNTL